jgi:hypothetical protein
LRRLLTEACHAWRCIVVVGISEEAEVMARVRLLHRHMSHLGGDFEVRVLPQIRRKDHALVQDLLSPLPNGTRHRWHRYPPCVQQPSIGKVNIIHPHWYVIAVQGLGVVNVHIGLVLLPLLRLDRDHPALSSFLAFLKGQGAMVA